jgi:MFS family permease
MSNMTAFSSAGNRSPRTWSVGTLTYSAAGLVVLFLWLLWGDFAWSMRDRSVPNVLQILFKQHGVSDTLTGLLLSSLPSALGMLIGPVVSYKSDRCRSRWGRRIPFLMVPVPVAFLSMLGLAFSPQIGSWLDQILGTHSFGLNISVVFSLGLFWTLFELASVVANAVFGGLINDVVPQIVVGRFFGLFRAFSLIAGIVFNYWLFGYAETHYFWIFVGIGLLYGVGFTLMCLNVKEGEYPPVTETIDNHATTALFKIKSYFKECYGNPFYRTYFIATTLMGIATTPFNLYSVYYSKSIGMKLGMYGECLAMTYVISLVLAYPLGAMADRFHPLRITIVSVALYAMAMLWGALYTNNVSTFAVALIAHGVLSGTLFTASASLGQRLLLRERFAELSSAGGIIFSLVSMSLAPSLGVLLDLSRHNYRYTFHVGFVISVAAMAALLLLHRKFIKLGGVKNFLPPR